MKFKRMALLLTLLAALIQTGCDQDGSTQPDLDAIMPIMLGLPGTDWIVHSSMMGDTARVVVGKSSDGEDVKLYLRVTWGSCEVAGEVKSKPVCQVELRNQGLVDDIRDCLEQAYPGFWDRPLWRPQDYDGRWLAYGNHGQRGRPDHRGTLKRDLHRALLKQGLRLNEAIGLQGEHLPNGPFVRNELILWFIYPEEIEAS